MTKVPLYLLTIVCLSAAGWADDADSSPGGRGAVSFRRDVAPLLMDRCLPCHGPKRAEGGYRVDSFARASAAGDSEIPGFVGGDLEGSEAYRRVVAEDADERMPADSDPLPAEQIGLLRRWIEQGAAFDGDDPEASLAAVIPPRIHPPAPESYRHPLPVTALEFSADGRQLVVSGYHELTVWDVEQGSLAARIGNLPRRTMALDLAPDGRTLAAGGGDPGRLGEVRLLEMPEGRLRRVVGLTSDLVLDVAFSPGGEILATASADGAVRVFEPSGGEQQTTLTSHSDWVTALAWSVDGKRLATASRDKTAKVFDIQTGRLLASYGGHGEGVSGVAFDEDGKRVCSAGVDGKLHCWSVGDAKRQSDFGFGGEVFKLESLGDTILAPSADRSLRRLKVESKSVKQVRQFSGASDWVLATAYHAATGRVAAGCFNGEVLLWDAEEGALLRRWTAVP